MLQVKWARVGGVALLAGWLAAALGTSSVGLAAGVRGKGTTRQDPTQNRPEAIPKDEYTSSGDPDANITKLTKEKLELLREREEKIRTAMQAGKAKLPEFDDATLDVLRAELEVLEKPSLRIAAHEKIVAILKRHEQDAFDSGAAKMRSTDQSGLVSAYSRYVHAKLRRINAELALEKERSALQKEMGTTSTDSKAASTK